MQSNSSVVFLRKKFDVINITMKCIYIIIYNTIGCKHEASFFLQYFVQKKYHHSNYKLEFIEIDFLFSNICI